jgi:hypothetical protein
MFIFIIFIVYVKSIKTYRIINCKCFVQYQESTVAISSSSGSSVVAGSLAPAAAARQRQQLGSSAATAVEAWQQRGRGCGGSLAKAGSLAATVGSLAAAAAAWGQRGRRGQQWQKGGGGGSSAAAGSLLAATADWRQRSRDGGSLAAAWPRQWQRSGGSSSSAAAAKSKPRFRKKSPQKMGVTWNLLIAVAYNNIGIFLHMGFYTIATLSLFRPKPTNCTNSEVWVVTDFSVTVIQIKKLTKKRSYIRLGVRPGRVQLPKKYPGFFRGGYQSSSVFTYDVPCGNMTLVVFSI